MNRPDVNPYATPDDGPSDTRPKLQRDWRPTASAALALVLFLASALLMFWAERMKARYPNLHDGGPDFALYVYQISKVLAVLSGWLAGAFAIGWFYLAMRRRPGRSARRDSVSRRH